MKTIICSDLWGKKKRVSVSKLSFRPSVYGVILRDKKVLLSRQFDGYDFPGGAINLGETIDEALEREIWEETGLSAKKGELLFATSSFFIHPETGKYFHSILLFYFCTNALGKISTAHFDDYDRKYSDKAEWIPIARTKYLKFYNPVNNFSLIKKAVRLQKKI